MITRALLALLGFSYVTVAVAGGSIAGPSYDPYVIQDPFGTQPTLVAGQTSGIIRSQAFNPAQKTLVLIVGAAQSQWSDIAPTTYIPTNVSAIDNFNIWDSASRQIVSGLFGNFQTAPFGLGNITARVADNFVTNAIFDRVIIANMSVGSTTIDRWANGSLASRGPAVLRRLASRGFIQGATGLTFAVLIGIGETDNSSGTSQATFTAGLTGFIANMAAAGYTGRYFVCQETWAGGVTNSGIRAAQAAIVNNTNIFSAGDLDSFNATFRQPSDNLHFIDNGLLAVGNLVYNTMHASGAPF